jgi:uracil-DNA glycosylase
MLRFLAKFNKNIIHVLWGKEAQKLEKLISTTSKSMLMGPHPSGLSAYRGFIGCGHFKTINEMLKTQGKTEITWM